MSRGRHFRNGTKNRLDFYPNRQHEMPTNRFLPTRRRYAHQGSALGVRSESGGGIGVIPLYRLSYNHRKENAAKNRWSEVWSNGSRTPPKLAPQNHARQAAGPKTSFIPMLYARHSWAKCQVWWLSIDGGQWLMFSNIQLDPQSM